MNCVTCGKEMDRTFPFKKSFYGECNECHGKHGRGEIQKRLADIKKQEKE